MNKLIMTEWKGDVLTAQWTDGQIVRLSLDGRTSPSLLNRIYVGKVKNIVKNIGAAFIEFDGGMTGYYSLTENKEHLLTGEEFPTRRPLRVGDELVVQVERDAVKTKAPVLTGKISLAGRYAVLTRGREGMAFSAKITDKAWKGSLRTELEPEIPAGCSLIVRTNAYGADISVLREEIRSLSGQLEALLAEARYRVCGSRLDDSLPSYVAALRDSRMEELEEIVTDIPEIYGELEAYLKERQPGELAKLRLYEDRLLPLAKLYSLDTVMERALSRQVWLKSGGYLVIEPTEALTVIDVNSGKYSGRKNAADTIRLINREAAEEIGRQMILRNLSGIILVDFIDMEDEGDREELVEWMRDICRRDPVRTTVVDLTALNLMEITRKKLKKPLHEILRERERTSAGER